MFDLVSKFVPNGDQPQAIEKLVEGIKNGKKHQVLLRKSEYYTNNQKKLRSAIYRFKLR